MADFVQNGGSNGGTYASHFSGILSVWENSYDVKSNTSNVGYRLQLKSGNSGRFSDLTANYSVTINGTIVKSGSGRYNSQNYNSYQTICEGTTTITHNGDGKKTIACSAVLDFQSHTYSPGDFTPSGSLKLTDIPRIPTFTRNPSVTARTLNTLTFDWGFADIVSHTYYSLDNKNWIHVTQQLTTITGLNPNTKYTIYVQVRNQADTSLTATATCSGTTYDIAKISDVNNFDHGSNASVSITNPASISGLNLVMKIGDTQILSRSVSTGTNTITFSDTELDNLYKKYGSSNSLTATFILSGSSYTNSKTCTVTLKGNQKTIKKNISNSWKRGKIWINVNGTWRRAVIWRNLNGIWKREYRR